MVGAGGGREEMSMAIHIVNMNPSIDELIRVDGGSLGGVWTELESDKFPSGKGMNCAVALDQLGVACRVVCFCGEDRLDVFIGASGARLTVECVVLREKTRKNITVVDSEGGLVGHVRRKGFIASDESLVELRKLALSAARPGDLCLITGGLPGGVSREGLLAFVAAIRDAGCQAVLDTDLRVLKGSGVGGLLLVKPNLAELGAICEIPLADRGGVMEAAWRELGGMANYIVVSMGEKGALLIDGRSGERLCGSLPPVDAGRVNPTGCGDAMAAGLLSARQEEIGNESMLIRGLACGYANLFARRPGRMDMERYRWALKNVEIEHVARAG